MKEKKDCSCKPKTPVRFSDLMSVAQNPFALMDQNLKQDFQNTLKDYIKEGNSINALDEKGNTLSHAAAALLNKNAVESLIFAKADVNCKNRKGQTVLDVWRRSYKNCGIGIISFEDYKKVRSELQPT